MKKYIYEIPGKPLWSTIQNFRTCYTASTPQVYFVVDVRGKHSLSTGRNASIPEALIISARFLRWPRNKYIGGE